MKNKKNCWWDQKRLSKIIEIKDNANNVRNNNSH